MSTPAPQSVTRSPLSQRGRCHSYKSRCFSVRTHHRNQPPLSVGLFVAPLYSQQSPGSPLEALHAHAIVFNHSGKPISPRLGRDAVCACLFLLLVSCESDSDGESKTKNSVYPSPHPQLTSPSSLMTPFHSILSLNNG